MPIMHLETLSTLGHPSTTVQDRKTNTVSFGALQMIQAGASRRKVKAVEHQTSASEAKELAKDAEEMTKLVESMKQGDIFKPSSWDLAMTWIEARKAIIVGRDEAWMSARYGSSVGPVHSSS